VRVADTLRFSMYFHEYGETERARSAYAALGGVGDASPCSPCAAPCVAACPHGLAVRDLLLRAHGALAASA
jgi:predicted aldo/keto reductase-like oxidoreductase